MPDSLASDAIVFRRPGRLARERLPQPPPAADELLVEVDASGISSGTEKLLWRGTMPSFPGSGYPLVPGYEAVGRVAASGERCALAPGARVFVPGTSRWGEGVRPLFGASASRLVTPEARVVPLGALGDEEGVALALAATAMHALTHRLRVASGAALDRAALAAELPDLVVGHGVLGRLLARIAIALGGEPPTVWERRAERRAGARGYPVVDPADDALGERRRIIDASGDAGLLDALIGRLARGDAHLTLAGFYAEPLRFDFAPAFLRELSLSVAAEWHPDDMRLVGELIAAGSLALDGLVSHLRPASEAGEAYREAFDDPDCLKAMLRWRTA